MAGDSDAVESIARIGELERTATHIRWLIALLMVAFVVVPVAVAWWVGRDQPVVSTVRMEDVRLISPAELCPGDLLQFSYDLHAAGSGTLVRDATLWRMVPPRTIIFSTWRRFILDGPIDQNDLIEGWHVPESYVNPETGREEPLPAGVYRRYLAITSPTNATIIAIVYVEFSIREDCP